MLPWSSSSSTSTVAAGGPGALLRRRIAGRYRRSLRCRCRPAEAASAGQRLSISAGAVASRHWSRAASRVVVARGLFRGECSWPLRGCECNHRVQFGNAHRIRTMQLSKQTPQMRISRVGALRRASAAAGRLSTMQVVRLRARRSSTSPRSHVLDGGLVTATGAVRISAYLHSLDFPCLELRRVTGFRQEMPTFINTNTYHMTILERNNPLTTS